MLLTDSSIFQMDAVEQSFSLPEFGRFNGIFSQCSLVSRSNQALRRQNAGIIRREIADTLPRFPTQFKYSSSRWDSA